MKKIEIFFSEFLIVAFVGWISFFPQPIQAKYHLATKTFLMLLFTIFLLRKRTSIFKLNDFPLWIFLITIGINVFFTQHQGIAFRTYSDLAIPLFLIYYLLSETISTEINFKFLVKTISIFSSLVALGGILEFWFAVNPIYKYFIKNPFYERYITDFVRPMSTQFHPVALGTYLLASLPFNFLLFKQHKGLFKSLAIMGMVLNTTVIILTFSRGVFLGLVAMVVFYLIAQRKYRAIGLFLFILFMFIFICSRLPYPFNRFGVEWLGTKNRGIVSSYRLNRCIMTQRIIKKHPFVGLGFQQFRTKFYGYYPGRDRVEQEFMIADNMYLTILAETGIIGFSGFLIFMLPFLIKSWQQLEKLRNIAYRREQLLLILSAFIGLLVNMGAYELFYWSNQYMFFCVLIGCIGSFCKDRKTANNG